VRAAMQLRTTLAELGMPSIPSILAVPKVASAFGADGQPVSQSLASQTNRFLDEFEWYAKALAHARERGTPY
jgi:NAD(P)H-dependent FMN reductase